MCTRVLFLLLLAFALSPRPASGDPLRVTSGAFVLDIEGDLITFNGAGFSLRTTEFLIYSTKQFAPRCFFCAEGELVDWSFRTTGGEQLLGRGNAVLGGVTATNVDFMGSMRFTATPTPLSSGGALEFDLLAPFSFEGAIRGVRDGEELFARQFIGSGTMAAHYEINEGLGTFTSDDETIPYEFAGAPVPEPGTVLLLGSGLAAAVLRRRRRES